MKIVVVKCRLNLQAVGKQYVVENFPRTAGELSGRPFTQRDDGLWENRVGTVVQVVEPVAPAPATPDQAFKADDGKPNWFLLMSGKGCAAALAGVVRVLSFAVRPVAKGGKGYTEHSWREVPNARERYEAALYRHLNKLSLGELVDDESGESHWDHVATNALFLSELTKAGK